LKILKDHPDEYEKFCNLKDGLTYSPSGYYQKVGLKCLICNN